MLEYLIISHNEYMKKYFLSHMYLSCYSIYCCKVSVATMGRRKLHYYVMLATYPEYIRMAYQISGSASFAGSVLYANVIPPRKCDVLNHSVWFIRAILSNIPEA